MEQLADSTRPQEDFTSASAPEQAPASAAPAPSLISTHQIAKPQRFFVVQKWDDARQYLIHHLPRWMLNNSSNFVGSIQLVAEMFMFKSSNNDLITKGNEGKPLHWIIDPPRNIIRSVGGKSKFQGKFTDIFKPSSYPRFFKELKDLEGAALRDSEFNTVKLTNRWSARSGLMGMTSMALATLLPERGEGPEETQRMDNMAHEHTLHYVGHRLYQALNPVEVWKNKRPLVGLGMTLTGIFSMISGWRQTAGKFELVNGVNIHGPQTYRRNLWQVAGGAITMAAGSQLFLAVNNEQGWRRFGTTQLARFLTLPGSIGNRFEKDPVTGRRENGAAWYFGAQTIMAVKNTIASLIGGVNVKEDGTLVDHAAERREITALDKEERLEKKLHAHDNAAYKPQSVITGLVQHDTIAHGIERAAA